MADLLAIRPNGATPRSETLTRERWSLETPWGALTVAPHPAPLGTRYALAWVCRSRAELADLRAVLDGLRGRWGTFDLPTMRLDLEVIGQAGTTRTIRACGYAALVAADPTYRQLVYYTPGTPKGSTGSRIVTATNVVDHGDGTESFTVTSSIGNAATGAGSLTSAGARWMFRRTCRLAEDAYTIRHRTGEVALVEAVAEDVSGSSL